MAKIKFGMMMTDARGKLGGQVFSKNRSGAYVRTKVTPSNPRTRFQQENRSVLGSVSSGWSNLTSEQRSAWNNAVEQWQKTNVFGDLQKPSGKNLFTSLNKVIIQHFAGADILVSPPAKVEFMPFILDDVSTGAGALNVVFGSEQTENMQYRVRATPPISAGTTFVNNLFRSLPGVYVGTGGLTINIISGYLNRFGPAPSGQKIAVEVTPIGDNGQLGVPAIIMNTLA